MPTRILFTIPNFITAGSGRALVNVIAGLDRARFQPSVAVLQRGGKLEAELEAMGVPVIEAPFTVLAQPYATLPARAWAAARPFRPHRFELWHSFHYLDDYTEALVARLAGARAWIYTKKNMKWHRRAWIVRSLLATRVAAQNTDMMRDFFASPLFRGKTRLIPRGVDTTRFRPGGEARLGVRARYGLQGRLVVSIVAHLVPLKGHPTLIRAVARVPNATLLIAGKPLYAEYAAELVALADELGIADRVHFLGDVTDVPALLAETDVFVLSTSGDHGEGCPVALLEAMASGVACVATDVPGARDVIEHGKSGLLAGARDPDDLAAALKQLDASPELRRALGAGARQRVLDQYTIEREVGRHTALYEELVA